MLIQIPVLVVLPAASTRGIFTSSSVPAESRYAGAAWPRDWK
jgi:hypothetical protein